MLSAGAVLTALRVTGDIPSFGLVDLVIVILLFGGVGMILEGSGLRLSREKKKTVKPDEKKIPAPKTTDEDVEKARKGAIGAAEIAGGAALMSLISIAYLASSDAGINVVLASTYIDDTVIVASLCFLSGLIIALIAIPIGIAYYYMYDKLAKALQPTGGDE